MASLRWNRLFPACFLFRVPARPGDPPAVPTAAWKPVREAESRTQHQPGPPEPESASSPDPRVRWRQGTLSGATVALLGEEGVSFQLLGAWLGRQVRPPEPDGARRTGGGGTHFTQARPDPEASLRPRRADGRDGAFALRVRCRRRPGGRRMLRAQEVRVRNRETPQACPSGPFGAFVSRGDHLLSSGLGGPLSLEIRAVVPGRRARGPEAFSSNSSAEDAGSARVSVFRDSSQTHRKRMEAFVRRVAARYWRK